MLAKRSDHVDLARIVFVSRGLPVQQGREAASFEHPRQRCLDALRLFAGLTTPRAQPNTSIKPATMIEIAVPAKSSK